MRLSPLGVPHGVLLDPGVPAALLVEVDAQLAENVEAHHCELDHCQLQATRWTAGQLRQLLFTPTSGIIHFLIQKSLLVDHWNSFLSKFLIGNPLSRLVHYCTATILGRVKFLVMEEMFLDILYFQRCFIVSFT